MPQPFEADSVLIAARDHCDPRRHHLKHRVLDAARIAATVAASHPHTPSLRSTSCGSSSGGVRGLVAAGKINSEFLASDRWKVERKQRILRHDGRGARLIRKETRLDNGLLRELLTSRHSRQLNPHPRE